MKKPYESWFEDIGRIGDSADTCRIYTIKVASDDPQVGVFVDIWWAAYSSAYRYLRAFFFLL